MPYIIGPFRDSANVLANGYALVEQTIGFSKADGVVIAVAHRATLHEGILYEDPERTKRLYVPLPPSLDFPVFLALKIGAEEAPRLPRRFPEGTLDGDSVSWADMIPMDDAAQPTQWIIPEDVGKLYGSAEEALAAAAAAGISRQGAELALTQALAAVLAAEAEAAAAQKAAAAARGRIVLVKPDPWGVLPDGRPTFIDAPTDDEGNPIPPGQTVNWGQIIGTPDVYPPAAHEHDAADVIVTPAAGDTPARTVLDELGEKASIAFVGTKADIESPEFTGAPLAPSLTDESPDNQIATKGDLLAPGAHTHPSSDVIVADDGDGNLVTLTEALSGLARSADVDTELTRKADLDSPIFEGTPLAPAPTTASDDAQVATKGYVDSAVGVDGEIPAATTSTKGAIILSPDVPETADGGIVGTFDKMRVRGWRSDFLTHEALVAAGVDIEKLESTARRGVANGYAPTDENNQIPAAFLANAPQGTGGGSGDMGAIRPESYTGSDAEKLQAAINAGHAQGKTVYLAGRYTLDETVSAKNMNCEIWGPGRIIVPASSTMGAAFSAIHDTLDHFAVKSVGETSFGWSGSGKPANSDTTRVSSVVPVSQASLAKVVSEQTWRLENKWSGDKYVWSEEVGSTVLKGSHFPVMGVMFAVSIVPGKAFIEGDTVVQKNSAGTVVATGVLKGYQRTAINSSKQYTAGKILFETLEGTFSKAVTGNPGTLLVGGVEIGSIVADADGELGRVLMRGMPLDDTFTNNPASGVSETIIMRRLPKYRFSMKGLTFDVSGNPEDNTNRRERPNAIMLGNVIAPEVDVRIFTFWASGLVLAGCPNYTVNLLVNDGPNDARFMSDKLYNPERPNPDYDPLQDIGAYGYGFEKYGACDNGYAYIRGGKVRHLYTTNPDQRTTHALDASNPSDFAKAATGTSRDCVTEMFAYDCYAQAYDGHEGCYREVLQNFYIAGSMAGGMKDSGKKAVSSRGFGTIVRNGIIVGSQAGIVFASIHIKGSPFKNHLIAEGNLVIGYQETAINAGNLPAESSKHKVTVRRNSTIDAGFAKGSPWDASAVNLAAVDMDVVDNQFGRSNYSPIRLYGSVPATGVKPKIKIKGNDFDYSEVINSTTNKAKGCDFAGTDGFEFLIYADNTVTPLGTGTARQPQALFTNVSGDGLYRWSEGGYIESAGEAVPVFTSTAGAPTHGKLSRAAMPTTTAEPPPEGGGDPNDNTATTPSITPWIDSRYMAVGDSSGILAQTSNPIIAPTIDYGAADIWPRLIGTGFVAPPDPKNYPKGIDQAVVNRHIGSSTTPDVALRLLRNAAFRTVVHKFVPGAWDLVTMLCGGNDVGHFHASGARGEQVYKDGLSTLAGIFRARAFVYTSSTNETGTWTNSSVQYGDRTRVTVTPGSTTKLSWTGKNATLVMLAPEDGTGSAYTTKLDSNAEVPRTTKGHGHDTELSSEQGHKHTPVPIHYRNLATGTHTVTIKHTGAQGDPLVVEVLLPWQDAPKDMPFVVMVPPGKSTTLGYNLYPTPKPENADIDRFRGLFDDALAEFNDYGNLVRVALTDIDAAMPYNDYDVRIGDGLHPNKQGHKNIANAVLKTLIKYKPSV